MANTKIVVDCSKGTIAYLPLSAAEIAERDQSAAAFAEAQAQRQADAEALAALKESAKVKLTAGEPLTEEEASTLVI
jgi:uncharacterized coiled-coil DUF342 family protein